MMRRFAARALSTATANAKAATGLVGLEVEVHARSILIDLYNDTLSAVEAIPADAAYRQEVEAFTKHRLAIVEKEELVRLRTHRERYRWAAAAGRGGDACCN